MKYADRFRSVHRATAFLVGMAPLVWLNTAFPGPIWTSISDILANLALFGPAALSAFGMAYLVLRLRIVWLCVAAAVSSFLVLLTAYNASLESSTAPLAFLMVSPAYIAVFLAGLLCEAAYRKRRASRIGVNH